MPTRNRAAYVGRAVESYSTQTYPNRELIIVDNGQDGTEHLLPQDPTIHYSQVEGTKTTGEMRNLCVERSSGEIICHFDSDDWSAPGRVADQVARLGATGIVTGYSSMYFYDERDGKCYLWAKEGKFALGTSLCYRRSWWMTHPFQLMNVGEDFRFFQSALREANNLVITDPCAKWMVARVHDQQTSKKLLHQPRYQPVARQSLPAAFPCV